MKKYFVIGFLLLILGALGLGYSFYQFQTARVPLPKLEEYIAQEFPITQPLGGVGKVSLLAPTLTQADTPTHLKATLPFEISLPLLGKAVEKNIVFNTALDYRAEQKQLFLKDVTLDPETLGFVPPQYHSLIQQSMAPLLQKTLNKLPIYTLQDALWVDRFLDRKLESVEVKKDHLELKFKVGF